MTTLDMEYTVMPTYIPLVYVSGAYTLSQLYDAFVYYASNKIDTKDKTPEELNSDFISFIKTL